VSSVSGNEKAAKTGRGGGGERKIGFILV
jgi:hypothetical protein